MNSALELAPHQSSGGGSRVTKTLDAHARFYRALMDDAKSRGELPKRYDTGRHAQALLALVLGMRVMARGGMPASPVRAVRAQAEELLGGGQLSFFDLF